LRRGQPDSRPRRRTGTPGGARAHSRAHPVAAGAAILLAEDGAQIEVRTGPCTISAPGGSARAARSSWHSAPVRAHDGEPLLAPARIEQADALQPLRPGGEHWSERNPLLSNDTGVEPGRA
jgi:hypothetical protein